MDPRTAIARALASAWEAGTLDDDELVERAARLLGRRWRWLRPLAARVRNAFVSGPRPRRSAIERFLLADIGFDRACLTRNLAVADRLATPRMAPAPVAKSWKVPSIVSEGALAAWLGITPEELAWFADLRNLARDHIRGPLGHYHYRTLNKRFGRVRLIESPKPRLKVLQRRVLEGILDAITVHPAVHGFERGRSIISFATPHVGKPVVLRIDLADFFPSIIAHRVKTLFRTAGYPERVADLLAGLCTTCTPFAAWDGSLIATNAFELRVTQQLYARRHLPQGAPTSPSLANRCAYRMDCRLAGLAKAAGAFYTRYADDLAFSGDAEFARAARRFQLHACAVVMEEGFTVHHRKTRVMRSSTRQHLAGVVVNARVNIRRAEYDRLEATLTNCSRHGVEGQNLAGAKNFREQLRGQISFVEMVHPARGQRLRALFDRIAW